MPTGSAAAEFSAGALPGFLQNLGSVSRFYVLNLPLIVLQFHSCVNDQEVFKRDEAHNSWMFMTLQSL